MRYNRLISVTYALLLSACLERVTGEKVPLDPAFYAAVEAERGDPNQGSGSSVPFSNDSRPKITISGTIVSENPLAVDIDLRVPDSSLDCLVLRLQPPIGHREFLPAHSGQVCRTSARCG